MKTKIGKIKCETCGELVTVRKNEHGTLSYRCDECDAAPYARPSTGQFEKWMSKVESAGPTPEPAAPEPKKPAPKAEPKPPPKPEPKPAPKNEPPAMPVVKNIWGFPQ